MDQFITFMSIRVVHDYYQTSIDRHIALLPTPETKQLMCRRGLFFKHQGEDCWQWTMRSDNTGFEEYDVLELSLQVSDPDFLRVTLLNDFYPQTFYQLSLSDQSEIDPVSDLMAIDEKKAVSELCRIRVKPSPALWKRAQEGEAMNYTIHFHARAHRWEYLFVMKDESRRQLLLEDTKGRITFEKSEYLPESFFGTNTWQIVSTTPVAAREHHEYTLILSEILQEVPLKKRILSRFIPCPRPGKYFIENTDWFRQVCYI